MNTSDYRKKLIGFNATDKYQQEMKFMKYLLDPKIGDVIFDYGCGLGTFIQYLMANPQLEVYGFDKHTYLDEKPEWFIEDLSFSLNSVCFMHSLAHIENVNEVLANLKKNLVKDGRICVITPNKDWLKCMTNDNYIPDPTVINHFTSLELRDLFINNGFSIEMEGQLGQVCNNVNERLFICVKN